MEKIVWKLFWVISILLIITSYFKLLPMSITEVLGFSTGAACVLLIVKENVWNFPVGIVNNVFFILLFLSSKLYGDMGLQFVYVAFAIHGWLMWVYGGKGKNSLEVTKTSAKQWVTLTVIGIISTYCMTKYFVCIHDSSPFLDALTTVMSLIAQYLLNIKKIENWYIWIAADVIYIGLYIYKDLYLTSVLYVLFIVMCVAGYRAWKKSMESVNLFEISVVNSPAYSESEVMK